MAAEAKTKKTVIQCVECGEDFALSSAIQIGQEIACPECGTWMEVLEVDPVQVDWVYDEPDYEDREDQEDW